MSRIRKKGEREEKDKEREYLEDHFRTERTWFRGYKKEDM
jgi:hypothetical protein